MHARARRRLSRGIKRKGMALLKKLRKAKKDCGPYDKPDVVKTHLRDMLIMPEMIGSIVGVHNGKVFTSVEVKADMVRERAKRMNSWGLRRRRRRVRRLPCGATREREEGAAPILTSAF